MKENNDIFIVGSVWNKKTLKHFLLCLAGFYAAYYTITLLKWQEALQPQWFAAGVAVGFVAYSVEFGQMWISRAKIDVVDLGTAIVAIAIGAFTVPYIDKLITLIF